TDIEMEFSSKLNEIEDDLAQSIEKMNMESEAKDAATKTISGYIQAIKNGQQGAVSAAQAVAEATSAALDSSYNITTGKVTSMLPGFGYANGTASAAPGLALVGEYGPELINFGGGEVVYTADETEQIIASIDNRQLHTAVSDDFGTSNFNSFSNIGKIEKKITLEIAGSGEIEVSDNISEESVLSILVNNIKPVLMGIIKQEIYEEGNLAYDY
ncbi:MAG: hypothetical protein RR162_00005, partial [Oscillospiraceae bacterium]